LPAAAQEADNQYTRCLHYVQAGMAADVYRQTVCGRDYPQLMAAREQAAAQQRQAQAQRQRAQAQAQQAQNRAMQRDRLEREFEHDIARATARAQECGEKYSELKDEAGGAACLAKAEDEGRWVGINYLRGLRGLCTTSQAECDQVHASNVYGFFCKGGGQRLLLADGTIEGATCDEWAQRKWAGR
jgi:hypothetical protein